MNKRMYTVITLPVQVSFSLTNPDLHSAQFPAPGPEHVCLQDKWQAGEEGRSIELVSRLFKATRITSQSVSTLMLCVPGPALQLQATQITYPCRDIFQECSHNMSPHCTKRSLLGIHSCLRIGMTFMWCH